MKRPMVAINLTEGEEKLFTFLLDVVKQNNCGTTLRVAGGWVRDKVLGRNSDDIDIVLDNMTGSQFANLINDYEASHGHVKHSVGIIQANPEQSKHLETATVQLGEQWVDFVNLRAETYTEHSRIPQVTFGTPLDDAERRDFTCNTLFYNIGEGQVEDFTGKGLDDLNAGIIRTPLEPIVTLLDDPIRALRAIRFASRFNFNIVEELSNAMNRDELKEALLHKVSRERVGKEVLGMITGSRAHPERAMGFLHQHSLCSSVFHPPDADIINEEETESMGPVTKDHWDDSNSYVSIMHTLIEKRREQQSNYAESENAVRLRILASALLPLGAFFFRNRKNKLQNVPDYIIRESLKLPNKDAQRISTIILKYFKQFQNLAKQPTQDRAQVGLLLRSTGDLWSICSDVGYVHDFKQSNGCKDGLYKKYDKIHRFIQDQGLCNIWSVKPLVNGKDVIRHLKVAPGPEIAKYQNAAWKWQLSNPEGTKELCLEHLSRLVNE